MKGTETSYAATTTAGDAIGANANRAYLRIQNQGSAIIAVSFVGTAVDTSLNVANGASVEWDVDVPEGAVSIKTLATTATVFIQEG